MVRDKPKEVKEKAINTSPSGLGPTTDKPDPTRNPCPKEQSKKKIQRYTWGGMKR